MDRSCRVPGPGLQLLVGWPGQAKEAIGLGLEGGAGDGPQLGTAPQPLAACGRIDKGRAGDRACPIEAFDTLDRSDMGRARPARPGIDGRRLVAGVDRQPQDPHRVAARALPAAAEHLVERLPAGFVSRTAVQHDVLDQPAFQAAAPCPDVDLDAVLLDVGAGGEEQAAGRNAARLPVLAPVMQALPVRRLAGLDPGLAENGVAEGLDRLVRPLGRLEGAGDRLP